MIKISINYLNSITKQIRKYMYTASKLMNGEDKKKKVKDICGWFFN